MRLYNGRNWTNTRDDGRITGAYTLYGIGSKKGGNNRRCNRKQYTIPPQSTALLYNSPLPFDGKMGKDAHCGRKHGISCEFGSANFGNDTTTAYQVDGKCNRAEKNK